MKTFGILFSPSEMALSTDSTDATDGDRIFKASQQKEKKTMTNGKKKGDLRG